LEGLFPYNLKSLDLQMMSITNQPDQVELPKYKFRMLNQLPDFNETVFFKIQNWPIKDVRYRGNILKYSLIGIALNLIRV
jgi:hypothetical protein